MMTKREHLELQFQQAYNKLVERLEEVEHQAYLFRKTLAEMRGLHQVILELQPTTTTTGVNDENRTN